jgi:hypothetical protein
VADLGVGFDKFPAELLEIAEPATSPSALRAAAGVDNDSEKVLPLRK